MYAQYRFDTLACPGFQAGSSRPRDLRRGRPGYPYISLVKQATSVGWVSCGGELSCLRIEIIPHPGEPSTVLWQANIVRDRAKADATASRAQLPSVTSSMITSGHCHGNRLWLSD
jgi:hypothetical protein